MSTLNQIETKTKTHALAREALAERVRELQDAIEDAKRRRLPGIKRAVEDAKATEAALRAAIEDSPELFEKPRTVIFYGIKVGFQKGKGRIEWDDDERVVTLIKRHFPDQIEALVKVTEKPLKTALAQLSVQELKKLGIEVEETGDLVVIKDTASDVDKLVTALLKEETEEVNA